MSRLEKKHLNLNEPKNSSIEVTSEQEDLFFFFLINLQNFINNFQIVPYYSLIRIELLKIIYIFKG